MIRVAIAILLFTCTVVFASDKYASPDATAGDGSIGNPWNLFIAFTNVASLDGNTLNLRGGTYRGPFKSEALRNCTVQSYPGEWAVVCDGAFGYISNALNTVQTSAQISGSEWWQVGQVVIINSESMFLQGVSSRTNWTVARAWDSSFASNHIAGQRVILKADIVAHTGTNCVFQNFEITSVMSTNRYTGTNWWLGAGLNLLAPGRGNKAINLIVHDTGHPGIGFWQQGTGGELNGCIIWGVGSYDSSVDFNNDLRGAAVYAQNALGMATMKNCITFANFTTGGKVFGETGPVLNFSFISNIAFRVTGDAALQANSGSTSTSNIWFNGNVMMGHPSLSYVSLSNRAQYFVNNVIVSGYFGTEEHADSVYTNNTVLMTTNAGTIETPMLYNTDYYPTGALNIVWDYNHYYLGNGSVEYQWFFRATNYVANNSQGGGTLKFRNDGTKAWTNWTPGWDAHSTYQSNWPTTYQNIQINQSDYNSNRWHMSVVSTLAQPSLTINPGTTMGWNSGSTFTIRDAQNYFTVLQNGVYVAGTITIPLTTTNVASIPGNIMPFVNRSSNVDAPGLFNAFVLDVNPSSSAFSGNISVGGSVTTQ